MRWRIYIDQFGVDLCYIEGKRNVLADCSSRLPQMEQSKEGGRLFPQTVTEFNQGASSGSRKRKREGTFIDFKTFETPPDNDFENNGECFFQIADDNELIDCLFPYSIDDGSNMPI